MQIFHCVIYVDETNSLASRPRQATAALSLQQQRWVLSPLTKKVPGCPDMARCMGHVLNEMNHFWL